MISGSVTVSFTGEAMNPSYCTITSSSSYKAENLSIPSKIWSSVAAM
jgi:type 1 fimbria pilin